MAAGTQLTPTGTTARCVVCDTPDVPVGRRTSDPDVDRLDAHVVPGLEHRCCESGDVVQPHCLNTPAAVAT